MEFNESMIKELWSGNISPEEKLINTDNQEINKISSNLDKLHSEISDKLEKNLFNKFNKYEKEHGKYLAAVSEEAFKLGFSLAVKIMTEVYQK